MCARRNVQAPQEGGEFVMKDGDLYALRFRANQRYGRPTHMYHIMCVDATKLLDARDSYLSFLDCPKNGERTRLARMRIERESGCEPVDEVVRVLLARGGEAGQNFPSPSAA